MTHLRIRIIPANGRMVLPDEKAHVFDIERLSDYYPLLMKPSQPVEGWQMSKAVIIENFFDFYEALRLTVEASQDNCVVVENITS